MAEAQTVDQNIEVIMGMLNNPEIQSATITVLSKMPTMAKMFTVLELGVDLVEPMIKDEDLIDQAFASAMGLTKPFSSEKLGAALALLDKLPLLVKLTNLLEMGVDLVEPMVTDQELLPLMAGAVAETATPIAKKAIDNLALLKEAMAKAEKDTTTYNVFGLMRFLKDPTVQKSLRIAAAYLNALSTRRA